MHQVAVRDDRLLKQFPDEDEEFDILIYQLSTRVIKATVKPGFSLDQLKVIIYDIMGIPYDQQRYIYDGKQMLEGKTLEEHNIKQGSLLTMVLRLSGC